MRVTKPISRFATFGSQSKAIALVGCAGVVYFNGIAVLTHVAVEAELRRQGIGGALVDKAYDAAKGKGVKVVALITMYYRFNWFKKWGFRTVPRAELPILPAIRTSQANAT